MPVLGTGTVPNFFIVGAPKCGTTALAYYLSQHDNVFIPHRKEPHFFSTDFHVGRNIESFEEYRELFAPVSQAHLVVGEASVWYLYSGVAIKNIFDFNPQSKIIVMLRNPVDLVQSLHAQQCYSFQENRKQFKTAWNLQALRRQGRKIPRTCFVPEHLQYAKIALLGEQVERILAIFPRSQVKMILFDDFRSDTKGVYQSVLAFLGVPDDSRDSFPIVNQGRAHRVVWLARLLQDNHNRPASWLVRLDESISKVPGLRRLHLKNRLLRLNLSTRRPPPISFHFREELVSTFRHDVEKLSAILGRSLDHWLSNEEESRS